MRIHAFLSLTAFLLANGATAPAAVAEENGAMLSRAWIQPSDCDTEAVR
ncbi:MAG: hypothetical protein NBKEAIPA_00014 [Nitrospirae bacterium]|nr:hypothetical protein [Nitrospirota bacterium]MEB2338104.1 hypothetical protein [Nitrospirales bacterium]